MRITELTSENKKAWDAFVASADGASFFHRSAWQEVLEKSFGHRTHFLCAADNGAIMGVLPLTHINSRLFSNALISNPFCVSGGPVAASKDIEEVLLAQAETMSDSLNVDYLEIRDYPSQRPHWHHKEDLYANFERPILEDAEEDLKQIPRKQRAVVRKALKNDALDITIDDTCDDFYDLYAFSVRNLGTPVFAKSYIQNLLHAFGQDVDILTVRHHGQAVSSVLSFYHKDKVLPYYTGSTFDARKLGSNDLMYWKLMRHGHDRGCRIFDFGRSKAGTGPYSFKKNWGFTPRPMVQSFYLKDGQELPNLNPTNPKYQMFINMWKRLPVPVANTIGPFLIRNLG